MGMAPSSGPIFLCLVTLWGHHSIFKREAHFRSEETESWKESSLELVSLTPKLHRRWCLLAFCGSVRYG